MPYPAAAIANELLERGAQDGVRLTQINIQKLVYFAQGWNLAWTKEPLFLDVIEAWQYGPVVRSLYNQFKRFGSAQITEKAVDFSIDTFAEVQTSTPSLPDGTAKDVVGAVWKQYGHLAPFKLVELTHLPGSPWETAYRMRKQYIPFADIQRYFEGLLAQNA